MASTRNGPSQAAPKSGSTELVSILGYILTVSYPLLALSTGVRALFQLFLKESVVNYLAPSLSLLAAVCYLTATIGFAYRRRWAWRLSVGVLLFETFLTLAVGSLSLTIPETIGRTVWRHFGADYGYFPLFQPAIGLVWLFWPSIMRQYGLTAGGSRVARNSANLRTGS
ncbi:MAG: hypothetical protein F4Z82_04010 [Caldilineaceae bacterium SB0668_bin_21]|nr:hypothetical protein [Caldilineaceae bacterium SB0668_bin_21]MYC20013.1 hypothetical protein [Caldilineaceae bacterium SB0662_bin_25]